MSKCAFCQHENSDEATRCAKCQAWLIQSAEIAKPVDAVRPVDEPSELSTAEGNAYALQEPGTPREPIVMTGQQAFGLSPEVFAAVLQSLAAGNKIAAIKQLREATGMGLAEAKHAAEGLQRLGGLLNAGGQPADIEIQQADGVTKIVRRQVIVGNPSMTPELADLLRQVGVAGTKRSGCVTRVGALLLATLGAAICAAWAIGA